MTSNKVSKRSANYTNREIRVIMEEYIRRKSILENNSIPQQNIELKRKAWLEIAEQVNVISPTKRTYAEVRRKVSDMKSSAKRKMLRYMKEALSNESKSPLIKPKIDERLLEILHENGVIPPYKTALRRGISDPGPIHHRSTNGEEVKNKDLADLSFSSTSSIPVSVAEEASCSPTTTRDHVVVTDATHTPSSGYDTQSDQNRMKHLRESVDRLTSSVDRLGESLVKISKSLEKIVESNQEMFSTINSNVVRILESQQRNVQTACLPRLNNQQR